MPISTIKWQNGLVRIVDQTRLPEKLVHKYCKNECQMWEAIKVLRVRGAPLLGVAAAYGLMLGIWRLKTSSYNTFRKCLHKTAAYLKSSRPTAVNLFWAIDRMLVAADRYKDKPVNFIKKRLLIEAHQILKEDQAVCRKMAKFGARLINSADTLMTHCNAGALATSDFGTALGVIYQAHLEGKKIKVYNGETRPLLQGSRLTTWELMHHRIDVTLICDNMAADVMREGKINKIFVGADRIAANGDTANKIGTYSLAVLAKYHKIPFYVVAPVSTFDFKIRNGSQIHIEHRPKEEVIFGFGKLTAPKGAKVYNPAFDVTPNKLITAIVTERGILYPPFEKAIKKLKRVNNR